MLRRVLALAPLVVVLGATPALAGPDLHVEHGPVQAAALVWGNGVFFGRPPFERWLASHRRSYDSWARLHPTGRHILETAASLPVAFRPSQRPPAHPPRILSLLSAGAGSTVSPYLIDGLALVAALLLALAFLPVRRLAARVPVVALVERRRLFTAVAGLAIAVGIAAAKLAA